MDTRANHMISYHGLFQLSYDNYISVTKTDTSRVLAHGTKDIIDFECLNFRKQFFSINSISMDLPTLLNLDSSLLPLL